MTKDWLPEPAGIVRRGEVVFFREGEGTGLVTVVKIGYPEYTKGPMPLDEARSYWKEIK